MNFDIDTDLTGQIMDASEKNNIPVVEVTARLLKKYGKEYKLDHGTIVPLYFILIVNTIHLSLSILLMEGLVLFNYINLVRSLRTS